MELTIFSRHDGDVNSVLLAKPQRNEEVTRGGGGGGVKRKLPH